MIVRVHEADVPYIAIIAAGEEYSYKISSKNSMILHRIMLFAR